MFSSSDFLCRHAKNRTATLDGPMTCGYEIHASTQRADGALNAQLCHGLTGEEVGVTRLAYVIKTSLPHA